jgi:iron complex transport system substrate-binding protein
MMCVTLAMGLIPGLSACANGQGAGAAGQEAITITDLTGREVTLEGPAQRVIATAAADCEIIYALGAQDLLVARGEYCDWPAEVMSLPSVSTGSETNVEEIIALDPDVVIMATMAQTLEQTGQLEAAGIEVLASTATDINGTYEAIEMIGKALGYDAQAAALISDMQGKFAQIKADAAAQAARAGSIYFEVSPLEYGLWAAGNGTFMEEVAQMLGVENCFADVGGWAEVSEEQVISRDPAYIVTIAMYMGEGLKPEDEIAGRNGWGSISAVKNGDVWCLGNNELSRPSPRLAEGAQILYDYIYG